MPWEQDVPHAKPAKAAKEETEGKLKPLTLGDASKPGRRNTGVIRPLRSSRPSRADREKQLAVLAHEAGFSGYGDGIAGVVLHLARGNALVEFLHESGGGGREGLVALGAAEDLEEIEVSHGNGVQEGSARWAAS